MRTTDLQADPLDAYLADDPLPLPLPPIAPDGGFVPGPHIEPAPIPEATPETMVCLRDCRHYVEIRTRYHHGNARGTPGLGEPVVVNRYCRAIPGDSIELTDELVRECSEWDPADAVERAIRDSRQRQWLDRHPLVPLRRPST